jgi:hypothetical protein
MPNAIGSQGWNESTHSGFTFAQLLCSLVELTDLFAPQNDERQYVRDTY